MGHSASGAAGTASGAGGILSGFANRYKPNSFVRDAVVDGGSRMGAGGSVGFVGRAFGGIAARNGATLTSNRPNSQEQLPVRLQIEACPPICRSLQMGRPQV